MDRHFGLHGIPLTVYRDVLPPPQDQSTLFICSGMQRWKPKFTEQTHERFGTRQTCVRTCDIDEVGDGRHLTSFEMLGNFSFGNGDYERSVDLWDGILTDLDLKPDCVLHVHPTRPDHVQLWTRRGYPIQFDEDCTWSDGNIGGQCCEVYWRGLEIGNLVNPLGHSTDVGFGWERLLQVVTGTGRVDETELFDQSLPPRSRDHVRTLLVFRENGIQPGNKGREYVCRRLLRRTLLEHPGDWPEPLREWVVNEQQLRERRLRDGRRQWRKRSQMPPLWWWDTFGILPEELKLLSSDS